MEEELRMKGFYNSVNDLFNKAACSTEYKALLAEMLAHKWRTISDGQINQALASIERKGAEQDEQNSNQD